MFNSQRPNLDDLPTSRQLARATAISAAVAGALLVTVVLPAEYAIDPTGVGGALGFTEMGEIKAQLAQEAAADEAATALAATASATSAGSPATVAQAAAAAGEATVRSDVTQITLQPGQGAEVKAAMGKGARLAFAWSVSGGTVNFDTHADAPGIDYHGYGKGQSSPGEKGQLVAAFAGKHGWFWRNRGDGPVTVTLRTQGAYTDIKRVV